MTWIRDIVDPRWRGWEELYRNRWEHDAEVRSTHGVNCTGGCSWIVYVKEGIVTWEMQATDYPSLQAGLPPYEPRGCQRGISFSWHVYAPTRVKHPYLRGALAELWARARAEHADPVAAWASIVEDEGSRRAYQQARGRGGFRRTTWQDALELVAASLLYTAKRYGPDRVAGFSPIPAMSMVSYAGGSRFLQLFGGALLSFYDLYADFPPASPETWGEKTDVAESADWFNSKYLVVVGSNLDMTRTPDAHYAVEARHHGAKLVVLSPDFSQVAKHADWWLPVAPGMDGALFLAMTHVILEEFHARREIPYFADYLRRYSDAPFLVQLEPDGAAHVPGRLLRASDLARTRDEEHAGWKPLVLDRASGEPRMPQGSIGFRWQAREGQWNLDLRDGKDGAAIDPALTLLDRHDDVVQVAFGEPAAGRTRLRGVPVRRVETVRGPVAVTTVLDLLMADFGVARGLPGEWPSGYDDADAPYTPAWQERYTGIGRGTVVQLAREWAGTAERTRGRCTVIIGSGVNHWYHANLHYRAAIAPLVLCGCVGVNGGGLGHYTGQEKLAPSASWLAVAMALDWGVPPRLQNGPSFHYVHTDQWRYERAPPDVAPAGGRFAARHTLDHQVDAVRRGWLPFCPHFDESPIALARDAEHAGARSEAEVARWIAERLRTRALRFAVEDPDAPENWPRVWLVWRANALLSSAKGHEFFLRHYLGLEGNAVAPEAADGAVHEAVVRHPAPRGKLDLLVDVNFRMDTSALYADVVLPAASWYEKDDLNTTDLHSYIHPLGAAVPPCWESRTDWEIFKALAERVSALAPPHFPEPFRDVVAAPLAHDTPDEIAQPEVRDWHRGECEPVPGRTMPHLRVVERDYRDLYRRFCALGPGVRAHGVEERGVHIPVADLYDALAREGPAAEQGGLRMPSLSRDTEVANVILRFAPETNGEVAWRGFREQERRVGRPLADLAEPTRGVAYDFLSVVKQPRRILTSPCWSGITGGGRAYSAFAINVERLVPWRTLTGRQHLYLDHEAYRAFGEHLPVFKPRLDAATGGVLGAPPGGPPAITLGCVTPHGKWHMHTTYYDNLRMLTLSRGIEPFWLNDRDAAEIGVVDNDWVEAFNDSGVVVTRAAVSARIPRGLSIFYHAPERTISFPKSPLRGNRRAGGHNSLTRMRLKPVLMVGGYAQHCYRFNDYGPPASDRDTWVVVRKLEGPPRFY